MSNVFYKLRNSSHFGRFRRACSVMCVSALCCLLISVPSFALVSDSITVPFYTLSKNDYGGTTSVVGITDKWTSITAVTSGKYASPLFYKLPDSLIAGQSYIVSFDYSGDDFMYILSLYKSNTWDNFDESNRLVYAEGDSTQQGGHVEGSFVYNGEPWLAFQFVIAPSKVIRLSQLTITRLNPNAGVESRIDEQNSKLFDGEEVNTLPDDGLNNHLSDFSSKLDELKQNFNNTDLLNRIENGMKVYGLLWDSFVYNGEQKPYQIKWLVPLINFSVFMGLIGSLLGITKAFSDKSESDNREYKRQQESARREQLYKDRTEALRRNKRR